ncbi:FUSC family membrane protein [Coraliomargarita parva]|uniref:FUSC family membrane protein n=1 Tax=Coraliomargarita parva TaxID=3014050 RepID=UPI0022B36FDD|nr:FUSC family membrane protein [Coraliomargarita parva]
MSSSPADSASIMARLKRGLWLKPDRLLAVNVTVVMAVMVVPLLWTGHAFAGVCLTLGVLAGALSETDDHPKGRIKSLSLKVLSFAVASASAELLKFNPILLGAGFFLSTIGFVMLGGMGERYRGITFGAQLVGIYTMIGSEISPNWYLQPILLTTGALVYGLFSLSLLYFRPYRLLEQQLAAGFAALGHYMAEKARLFPSDAAGQDEIRSRLALLNVETVGALDRIRDVLSSYRNAGADETAIKSYLYRFMVLQGLHERAASSHERYELLSREAENRDLLFGIGELMRQLSKAARSYGESLLTHEPYQHPVALEWIVDALNEKLQSHGLEKQHPLSLLIRNLSRSSESLANADNLSRASYMPRLAEDRRPLWQRFRELLRISHPRMRYALRLSTAFLIGYSVSEVFDVTKGAWIVLTILFVMQQSYSQTRRRLWQRILGTFCGVVFGVLTVQFLTPAGQLLFMLASAYFFFVWLKRKYSVSVIFITTFVLCAFNLIAQVGVAVMLPRMTDTLIGSLIALITVRLLWPDWQSRRLPALLTEALVKNTAYFRAILQEYREAGEGDDYEYRIARRAAHRADNALVLAWRDIQLEPGRRQKVQTEAFRLTYLNHALLSYLSAFAAHRGQPMESPMLLDFADDILRALENACDWLKPTVNEAQESVRVTDTLALIRYHLELSARELAQVQYTTLYNLADITRQLLDEVQTIREES